MSIFTIAQSAGNVIKKASGIFKGGIEAGRNYQGPTVRERDAAITELRRRGFTDAQISMPPLSLIVEEIANHPASIKTVQKEIKQLVSSRLIRYGVGAGVGSDVISQAGNQYYQQALEKFKQGDNSPADYDGLVTPTDDSPNGLLVANRASVFAKSSGSVILLLAIGYIVLKAFKVIR